MCHKLLRGFMSVETRVCVCVYRFRAATSPAPREPPPSSLLRHLLLHDPLHGGLRGTCTEPKHNLNKISKKQAKQTDTEVHAGEGRAVSDH